MDYKGLDKYYTKQDVAEYCYNKLIDLIKPIDALFVEPSAGSGSFLKVIQGRKIGFDIEPEAEGIIKADFLNDKLELKDVIIIGNPPFGIKSKLAIKFLNKALEYSNVVGFILPIQFRKWNTQSKVNKEAKLIMDLDLREDAFEINGKDYKVRCCFQVWTFTSVTPPLYNLLGITKDLKIKTKPITKHPDFEMYQYNRTEETKKYFDFDWDFAMPRQGYNNYKLRLFHKKELNFKQQWIFFKAKDKNILNKLLKLDFVKLSRKNISTPGFGKADVIQEYISL